MHSITTHPEWAEIREWFHVNKYDRDMSGNGDVRARLEVHRPDAPTVRAWLLAVMHPCANAKCGKLIHRIREREGGSGMYFAAACELGPGTFGCSRGADAAEEYRRVEDDLTHTPTKVSAAQASLF